MAARSTHEVERWALLSRADDAAMIILVVDDSYDDDLAHAVASEDQVPAEHFGGLWGTEPIGRRVSFEIVGLGGRIERTLVIETVDRELLDAILVVPHLVAIMPSEIAGDANTAAAMAPRLGGAMIVEVEHRSEPVVALRAVHDR